MPQEYRVVANPAHFWFPPGGAASHLGETLVSGHVQEKEKVSRGCRLNPKQKKYRFVHRCDGLVSTTERTKDASLCCSSTLSRCTTLAGVEQQQEILFGRDLDVRPRDEDFRNLRTCAITTGDKALICTSLQASAVAMRCIAAGLQSAETALAGRRVKRRERHSPKQGALS